MTQIHILARGDISVNAGRYSQLQLMKETDGKKMELRDEEAPWKSSQPFSWTRNSILSWNL